jgi:hypothetical protein
MNVDGRPYLSASTTLVRLLLNISIHLYTFRSGKQFCPYLTANYRWVSVPFIPSDTKEDAVLLVLGGNLSGAVIFTPCSLGTNGQQRTTLSACHSLIFSYSTTRPQAVLPIIQRKYPNLPLLFGSPYYVNLLSSKYIYQIRWFLGLVKSPVNPKKS